jgi:ribosomal protein S18 acetylase RimI-like enzyme
MPEIAGELQTCTESTDECTELAEFSCGDGRHPAEAAVERIVADHCGNKRSDISLLVTREMPSKALVGLAIIHWKGLVLEHPSFDDDGYEDATYIAVLALSAQYRGGYTLPDGTPLSSILLREALRHIAEEAEGEIPPVQAVIEPSNGLSRALVESFGFVQPIETSPDLLYVRPRGLTVED